MTPHPTNPPTYPPPPKNIDSLCALTSPLNNSREISLFSHSISQSTNPTINNRTEGGVGVVGVWGTTFRESDDFVTSMMSPFLKLRSPLCSPSKVNCAIY